MIMKGSFLPLKNIKTLLILMIFFVINFDGKAQQFTPNTEIGFIGAASYYLGDLNSAHFNNSSATAGLIIRKNIDRRFSHKAELLFLNIAADDRDNLTDAIAIDRGLHFKSPIYELSGQIEFNFLPYESGNPLYTWTPFIYSGISLFHHNPQAENKNGEWVDLQPLGTEGQETTLFSERKEYSLIQFAIPIGGGLKISVNKSFNIILEYGVRKTFTDYLDDVSTKFVGGNGTAYAIEMSQEAQEMSDPTGTHIQGDQRGDPNQKDWYSFAGVTLSFKLNNDTKGCDY